ncbi:MAG: HEPN domain-containing protein [Truepera sp.]|nr:HEPN domain-containing protein [Truepera sp.]MBS3968042.1 HEPN domain-containing protein [Truepera sp.]MBS3968299.1 HEPN domain-containing protein [Truepera sp.]
MTNKDRARAFIKDAAIILDEASLSLQHAHYHRVMRKCQEAVELAVKGLFKSFGIEYPKSHILGRVIRKELAKFALFDREVLDRIAYISDSLAFDREPAFYGSIEGIPAAELYDQADAAEAIENTKWIIATIEKVISEEGN